jgi:undecaprenyl-diphosphatase
MTPWIELLLALLQGLTEPLPISSSGHLVVAQAWLGLSEPSLAFSSFVNFGSVLGVVAYYRVFLMNLMRESLQGIQSRDFNASLKYVGNIVLASIPAGLAGVLFADVINASLSGVRLVGLMLVLTGVLLVIVSRIHTNTKQSVSYSDGVFVGFAQAFALIPGLSRSGLTTIAGLLRGVEFDRALQFSLMIYIPISIAAGGWSILQSSDSFSPSITSVLSLMVAAVSTYVVIGWYRRLVGQRRLIWLAVYCLIVGLIVGIAG